jgi:hypothetical protein
LYSEGVAKSPCPFLKDPVSYADERLARKRLDEERDC